MSDTERLLELHAPMTGLITGRVGGGYSNAAQCTCGWIVNPALGRDCAAQHRRHLAAVLDDRPTL